MEAFTRVGVFVQMGAVKVGQSMGVAGEMRGNPVQNQSNAGGMAALYQAAKAGGITKAGGGGVQANGLVTPGAVKRVFADRHEFQVGEAHVLRVGNERVGEFIPAQPAVAVFCLAPPRTQMHLVNAHGGVQCVGALALGAGRDQGRELADHAGSGRAQFGLQGVGVGARRQDFAALRADLEFVK